MASRQLVQDLREQLAAQQKGKAELQSKLDQAQKEGAVSRSDLQSKLDTALKELSMSRESEAKLSILVRLSSVIARKAILTSLSVTTGTSGGRKIARRGKSTATATKTE